MDPGLRGAVVNKSLVMPVMHIAELVILKFFWEQVKKSKGRDLRTQTAFIL